MLQIKNLKVTSLDLDIHEVSWEVEDTMEDVFDYTFQVLRSESQMGPFDSLTPVLEDTYLFIDNILQVANHWRTYFYVVRVTNKRSAATQDFGPSAKEAIPDIFALEIRRHINILFREHAGRRCWILPARTYGQRCECWNATLQKKTRSGCQLCFDTSFVRGYLSPIEIWGQIDPSAKSEQNTALGAQQQVNASARFGAFPSIKPRDIIVEAENIRWRVVSVNQTEKARARVHQEISIHRIPERDIEYNVPLLLDKALKDIWFAPSRNYTNPTNLENFENEEIPGIFSLYPTSYPPEPPTQT